ncbi:MAG TPA: RNA polymerase sigma factor [Burkholderiaceae bacterium]|nr:RNA polymerase sigma factor [Burkholderiaceae bacterium]
MAHVETLLRPRAAEPLADHEVAARAAAGDAAAFALIMRRHNRLLFRTARAILHSDAEAEDALQEAYLRAWRAIDGFRGEAKLSTWLVRIVINESLARLRRDRGAQVIPLDASAIEPISDHAREEPMDDDADRQPEGMAMRAELRQLLEASIDRLPEAFRTVFVLRAVEEMSVEDVAAALDLPEVTVRTRLFRARGLLRERLSQHVDLALSDVFAFDGLRCDRIVAAVLARAGFGAPPSTP